MTNAIFIAATAAEIAPFELAFNGRYQCLISGIGPTATAIATMRAIESHHPDLIVQIGIAGAVDRSLSIGQVVVVASDYQADHGAWRADQQRFVGFAQEIYRSDFRIEGLLGVDARTVTTACTPLVSDRSEIETMEGAPFFAAAQACNVRAVQIRSISNYVGDPRSLWKIDQAIDALKNVVVKIF